MEKPLAFVVSAGTEGLQLLVAERTMGPLERLVVVSAGTEGLQLLVAERTMELLERPVVVSAGKLE